MAVCCAAELPSGVSRPARAGSKGLLMSMMTLPASASPYWLTAGAALAYGMARMTMSPAGALPVVPAVAPPPSSLARAAALAASGPMASTVLPPASARTPSHQRPNQRVNNRQALNVLCAAVGLDAVARVATAIRIPTSP